MLKRPNQFILILAGILAFIVGAAAAFAAPIQIKTGSELTAREWWDGAELNLPAGAVLYVDKSVRWKGKLTINGNGAWLRNRQGVPSATFNLVKGHTLLLINATLAQGMQLTIKGWKGNHGIMAKGGVIELRNVWINDGYGCEVWNCDSFTWIGGGTGKTTTYHYSAYFGNNLANTFADRVYVQGCNFRVGRKETSVRLMGASAQFINCTFDADTADGRKHNKESVQARHGDIAFRGCRFTSIAGGGLGPEIDGGKHARYSRTHPTTINIVGGSMRGYIELAGNSTLTTKDFTVTGRDPRGIGGPAAFNLKAPQKIDGVTMRPQGRSYHTAVNGFGKFAAPGWVIGDGCVLNGAKVK